MIKKAIDIIKSFYFRLTKNPLLVIVLFSSIVIIHEFFYQRSITNKLTEKGQSSIGVVTGITDDYVSYKFISRSGLINGSSPKGYIKKVKVGDSILVYYYTSDPNTHRIKNIDDKSELNNSETWWKKYAP